MLSDNALIQTPVDNDKRAQMKKAKTDNGNNKPTPVLIVRPRSDIVKGSIIRDVRATVNPINDPVLKMRETARGNLVLECKSNH